MVSMTILEYTTKSFCLAQDLRGQLAFKKGWFSFGAGLRETFWGPAPFFRFVHV